MTTHLSRKAQHVGSVVKRFFLVPSLDRPADINWICRDEEVLSDALWVIISTCLVESGRSSVFELAAVSPSLGHVGQVLSPFLFQ